MVDAILGASKDYFTSALDRYDAFLLGRSTYEKFAATWPKIEGDPYFDRINRMPKFVASRTLRTTTWNARLLEGDTATEIERLKTQPGKDIVKYGTGLLDSVLIERGLIDEFHFSLFPVVVGAGRRLFEDVDTSALKLKLTDTKTLASGVVVLSYVPA
jgi:dihydrofolate reductase